MKSELFESTKKQLINKERFSDCEFYGAQSVLKMALESEGFEPYPSQYDMFVSGGAMQTCEDIIIDGITLRYFSILENGMLCAIGWSDENEDDESIFRIEWNNITKLDLR